MVEQKGLNKIMDNTISTTTKNGNSMAIAKLWLLFLDCLGITTTIAGIVANFENIKGSILFILGVIFCLVRIYFVVVQKKQAVREKELELWHKQQDKIEREERNSRH